MNKNMFSLKPGFNAVSLLNIIFSYFCCPQMTRCIPSGSSPTALYTSNVPQQSTVEYIQQTMLQPPVRQQQQLRQHQHFQNQTDAVSGFRNMQTR